MKKLLLFLAVLLLGASYVEAADVYLRGDVSGTADWNTGVKFSTTDNNEFTLGPLTINGWCKIYDSGYSSDAKAAWKGYDSLTEESKNLAYRWNNGDDDNNFCLQNTTKTVVITYWHDSGTFKIEEKVAENPNPGETIVDLYLVGENYGDWKDSAEYQFVKKSDSEWILKVDELKGQFKLHVSSSNIWYGNGNIDNSGDIQLEGSGNINVKDGQDAKNVTLVWNPTTNKLKVIKENGNTPEVPEVTDATRFSIGGASYGNTAYDTNWLFDYNEDNHTWTKVVKAVNNANNCNFLIYSQDGKKYHLNSYAEHGWGLNSDNKGESKELFESTTSQNITWNFAQDEVLMTISEKNGKYYLTISDVATVNPDPEKPELADHVFYFKGAQCDGGWEGWKKDQYKMTYNEQSGYFELPIIITDEFVLVDATDENNLKEYKVREDLKNGAWSTNELGDYGNDNNLKVAAGNYSSMTLYFDPATKKVMFVGKISGSQSPDVDGKNVVYFVVNAETDKLVTDNLDRLYIYAYDNEGENDTNGNWPGAGLNQANGFALFDTDVIPGQKVYRAILDDKYDMFVICTKNTEDKDAIQSRNFAIVNQGVYFFNDKRVPFGKYLPATEEGEEDAYRRYDNTADHLDPNWIYIAASEFGDSFGSEDDIVYIHVKQGDVHKTGLIGSSQMFREEYNGKVYYKYPAVNVEDGSKVTLEFSAYEGAKKDDGSYSNDGWMDGGCKATEHSEDGKHLNCSDPKRVVTYPEEVEYKNGYLYSRYPNEPVKIFEVVKPLSVTLKVKRSGSNDYTDYQASRVDEDGVYFFNDDETFIKAGDAYYFDIEYTEGHKNVIAQDNYAEMRHTSPYAVDLDADLSNVRTWPSPVVPSGFEFRVRLDWLKQQTFVLPVGQVAFSYFPKEEYVVDAVRHEDTPNEDNYYAFDVTTHKDFNDAEKHHGQAKVTVTPAAEFAHIANLKCYNAPCHKATLQPVEMGDGNNEGTASVHFIGHTAGIYDLAVESFSTTYFDYKKAPTTVRVRPTLESLGVTVNGLAPAYNDGIYTLNYQKDQLAGEDGEPVVYIKNENNPARSFTSAKAFIDTEAILDGYEKEDIGIYFLVEGSAPIQYANSPVADAEDTDLSAYTKYDINNSLNLDQLIKNNQSAKLVVVQNGIKSAPATINFDNTATGVDQIEGVEDAEVIYYDLQGNRIANPERGIYIRVINGKADKILL